MSAMQRSGRILSAAECGMMELKMEEKGVNNCAISVKMATSLAFDYDILMSRIIFIFSFCFCFCLE